jgi:preprotein translocase subunit SecG
MRTYYINNGNENGGPFTIEELRSQKISTATLVWYSGMDEWKYAAKIEELKPFFKAEPPPLKQTERPIPKIEKSPSTLFGLKKSHLVLATVFVVIMIFVLVLNVIQYNKRSVLDERNKQTELGNEKVKLEQKVATEQRIQEEIQKKIISENTNNFKKDSINTRLSETY